MMRCLLFCCLCLLVSGLVDDKAHLLSTNAVAELNAAIGNIKRQSGYDVIILTKPTNEVEATSAQEVARANVGNHMSGVVFLVTPKGLWIFNSRSLDLVLTSVVKKRLWSGMTELMKTGQFDAGLLQGVSMIRRELLRAPTPPVANRPRSRPPRTEATDWGFLWALLLSGVFLLLVCHCVSSSFGRAHPPPGQSPVYGIPLDGPSAPPLCRPNAGGGGLGGVGSGGGWMSSVFGAMGGVFLGNMLYDSVFSNHHYHGHNSDGGDMAVGGFPDEMDNAGGFGGGFDGGDFGGGGDFAGGDF